jgi:hypothetical protein
MANDRSSVETARVPMLSVFKGHAPPLVTLIAIEKNKRREVGSSRRRNWLNRVNHTVGGDITGFRRPCQGQSRATPSRHDPGVSSVPHEDLQDQ